MSAISPLSMSSQSLSEAQRLVAAIRAGAATPATLSGPLSQLQAVLERTQAQIADAQAQFEQQSERLRELSALVVGSNVRHF